MAKTLDAEAQTNLGPFVHLPWNGQDWQHLPGMVVTLLALTLGGPLWFDLLLTLINMRGAGRKPKRKDQPPH